MRIFHHFTRRLTMGAALLLVVGSAFDVTAQNAPPGTATVVRLEGKARFSTDNKNWHNIRNGSVIGAGAVIQTADNSTLDLRLGENGVASTASEPGANLVRLSANSVLAIEGLSGTSGLDGSTWVVELDLSVGQLTGRVGPLPAGSRYEIKFPNGVAGVRSGIYRLTASGVVDAMTGEVVVVVVGADGAHGTTTTKVVTAGHRLDPATGLVADIPAGPTGGLPASKPQPAPESPSAVNHPATPPMKGPGLGGSLRKF